MRKVSFSLLLPFHNFSRYDIVHLLIAIPQVPNTGGKAKILTTVNEFVLLNKDSIAYKGLFASQSPPPKLRSIASKMIGDSISRQIFSSDFIAVNSTQTMKEAIKLGYPKERIFIVPHGVDERFLSPIKRQEEQGL